MLSPDEQNAIKLRHLRMQAEGLVAAVGQLWYNYQQIWSMMDMTDEASYDKCVDMGIELEQNLQALLGHVREQTSTMEGYFEPLPDVPAEGDFEADVLRDLENLDKLLEPVYNKDMVMGWDDPENPHLVEEIPTSMTYGQFLDIIKSRFYNGNTGQ